MAFLVAFVGDSSLGLCQRVVSLGKKFGSTLHIIAYYKFGPVNIILGKPWDGLAFQGAVIL